MNAPQVEGPYKLNNIAYINVLNELRYSRYRESKRVSVAPSETIRNVNSVAQNSEGGFCLGIMQQHKVKGVTQIRPPPLTPIATMHKLLQIKMRVNMPIRLR